MQRNDFSIIFFPSFQPDRSGGPGALFTARVRGLSRTKAEIRSLAAATAACMNCCSLIVKREHGFRATDSLCASHTAHRDAMDIPAEGTVSCEEFLFFFHQVDVNSYRYMRRIA